MFVKMLCNSHKLSVALNLLPNLEQGIINIYKCQPSQNLLYFLGFIGF